MKIKTALVRLCVVVTLLAAAGVETSFAEPRNRALARALGDGYSAAEGREIERAFRAVVQAGMREGDVVDLVETCVDGGFSAQETLRVLSLAAQLALQELPVDSFRRKIEEGVAKGVAADRVLQVGEKRALALHNARQIVNNAVLEGLEVDDLDELSVDVAEALEAGVPAAEVRRVLNESRGEDEDLGAIRRKLFP